MENGALLLTEILVYGNRYLSWIYDVLIQSNLATILFYLTASIKDHLLKIFLPEYSWNDLNPPNVFAQYVICDICYLSYNAHSV